MARNHTVLTATDMVTLRSLFCLGTKNHKSNGIVTIYLHAFSTAFQNKKVPPPQLNPVLENDIIDRFMSLPDNFENSLI